MHNDGKVMFLQVQEIDIIMCLITVPQHEIPKSSIPAILPSTTNKQLSY